MKQITIIYRANCYDGFLAAYAAWLKLGDTANYVPMGYDDIVDVALFKDHNVYMVDFSVKHDIMCLIAQVANKVTVIDHHKTAKAELTGRAMPANVEVHFDMGKAGCVMAAEFFLGYVPWFFKYIGDRDIWAFEHPETKDFCAGFFARYPLDGLTFEDLSGNLVPVATEQMCEREAVDLAQLCSKGDVLIKYRNSLMKGWLPNLRAITFHYGVGGKLLLGVMHNVPIEFASEMGHMMLEASSSIQAAAIVSTRHFDTAGHPVCSISWRSEDGRHDVSEIAKSFGGGGHRNAAGCTLSFADAFELGLFN